MLSLGRGTSRCSAWRRSMLGEGDVRTASDLASAEPEEGSAWIRSCGGAQAREEDSDFSVKTPGGGCPAGATVPAGDGRRAIDTGPPGTGAEGGGVGSEALHVDSPSVRDVPGHGCCYGPPSATCTDLGSWLRVANGSVSETHGQDAPVRDAP